MDRWRRTGWARDEESGESEHGMEGSGKVENRWRVQVERKRRREEMDDLGVK